jgi:ubiquitin C-terminal hydrolase
VAYTTTTNIVEKLNLKLSKGIVVCALADVLKMKWSQSDKTSISPHKFKKYFGQLNTVFSGRTQEDAH